jgi:hypothetical protein
LPAKGKVFRNCSSIWQIFRSIASFSCGGTLRHRF